jgi:hypothetical protein
MIFEDAVLSFLLETDATFGDVARTLSDLSGHGYGDAVAIDVTLPDAALASHRHSDACVAARSRLVDGGGDRRPSSRLFGYVAQSLPHGYRIQK